MSDVPDYLFNRPTKPENEYDDAELRAARIRLGLERKKTVKKKRKRHRRIFNMPDIAGRARYNEAEEEVLGDKATEHKVSVCKYCRDTIWLDLFGEKWKAEGGSVLCGKAPFMTHEPTDG